MQLPDAKASPEEHRKFSRSVLRRLRRAKMDARAETIVRDLVAMQAKVETLSSAEDAYADALDDRDLVDGEADEQVQQAALSIRSRSPNAAKEEPYTLVLPDGVDAVLDLPVPGIAAGLRGFARRLAANLSVGDPALFVIPTIEKLAGDYEQARAVAEDAEVSLANASASVDASKTHLRRTLERTYGELVAELGRKKAERFFPRSRRKAAPQATT